jgi:hypothetical protein
MPAFPFPWQRLWERFATRRNLLIIFSLLAIISATQSLLQGPQTYTTGGPEYNRYNNYVIFATAPKHLLNGQNLYTSYSDEYHDIYKYSPTFALLMWPLYILPDSLGLHIWNLLNALVWVVAVFALPGINNKQKTLILMIALLEMLGNLQNEQSNGLMAGLMILSVAMLERRQLLPAALAVALATFIKPFAIGTGLLFLLYPQRWRAILYLSLAMLLLALLPLIAISTDEYLWQLQNWSALLRYDHGASYGFSVLGLFDKWFHWVPDKIATVIVGAGLFSLPLWRNNLWKRSDFRLLYLASLLVWVVIFNHKAESPTFIIAMTGAGLWFVISPANKWRLSMIFAALLFVSLSHSDIFPRLLRDSIIVPYNLKALPMIIVWLWLTYDLLMGKWLAERPVDQ